jgi:hypothetical protein
MINEEGDRGMRTIRTLALLAVGTAFSAVATAQVVSPKEPPVVRPPGAPDDRNPPMPYFKDDPIRRQVLETIEPPRKAEAEARDELDRLLRSGSSREAIVPPKSKFRCSALGCSVDVLYRSVELFRIFDEKRLKDPALPRSTWRGGVGRTGLLRTDTPGKLMATWFVLYPSTSQDQRATSP